ISSRTAVRPRTFPVCFMPATCRTGVTARRSQPREWDAWPQSKRSASWRLRGTERRAMKRCIAALLLCCLAAVGAEENLDSSRDAMARGVKLFQGGRYREAAAAFERAAELTPTNLETKLYLGVCYMAQFNPASQDAANLEFAHKAETQFMAILRAEPADDTALSYMAN